MQAAQRQLQQHDSVARAALRALGEAHAGVLDELANMQAIQNLPSASPDQWAYARWRTSRASRARRTAAERAYPITLAAATPMERARIAELQAQDPVMLATSRDHVAHWTPERIEGDWTGYCAASRRIRAGMAERVRREQDVLIPILTRLAGA